MVVPIFLTVLGPFSLTAWLFLPQASGQKERESKAGQNFSAAFWLILHKEKERATIRLQFPGTILQNTCPLAVAGF